MKHLTLLASLILLLWGRSSAQTLLHAEMLGRPTDHSVTVQAFFSGAVEMCVQYGTAPNIYSGQTPWQSFAAGEPAEVAVQNLTPDTRYFYRMCYRSPGSVVVALRPEHHFSTQRSKGNTFVFTVQADPHLDEQSDSALYRRCLLNQLQDDPDFMIDLGDFLMSDKLKNASGQLTHDTVTYRCHLLRSYYETLCHSVPLFIANGNHEGESGWFLNGSANNIAIWGTTDRKKYFINPAPDGFYSGDTVHYNFVGQRESYYSWTWGDALFVVLDPYWFTSPKPDSLHGWRWTLGKAQYDWLKTTLESSDAPFKFVFAHQLVGGDPNGRGGVEFADKYEWGGQNIDGTPGFAANRPGWYKPIKDLLTENRVNVFFHGHDHFFGKQEKDCLIYQETPQPSHPNFQNANQADDYGYFAGEILPNSGHLRVTVGPDGVKVEYVRAYLPQNENGSRHNGDVSATYFIGATNCYDSLSTGAPVLWNSLYADELVYPNPFMRETTVEFSVEKQERVSMDIVDGAGRVVRRLLIASRMPEGRYQIVWDGKDGGGLEMPSGAYWYRIGHEDGSVNSGQILLVK